MEGVVMMKVLFGNDIEPTEIKNENLFNRMTTETWDVEDNEIYDDTDEITGKFVSRCRIIHLKNGEIHNVESSIACDIAYGDYMEID